MVISSILSSYWTHVYTALFFNTSTASFTSLRIKAGTTSYITCSFDMNSHNPSEAITINLWSKIKQIMYLFSLKIKLLQVHLWPLLLMPWHHQMIGSLQVLECFMFSSKLDKDPFAIHLHQNTVLFCLHLW